MPGKRATKFKVGVTDWALKLAGDPEAVLWASELLFDCLQVSIGRKPVDGKLALASPALQKKYLAKAKELGCPVGSLCLDILHDEGIKPGGDKGQRWIADAIPIARALGVQVILLPFFGAQELQGAADIDRVGDVLRELAPAAAKAHVILGLETTLSARDQVRIIERSRSKAVQVYYDVGNATAAKFDVVEEIRWLGAGRLCEVHVKDNPHFLGEGAIDVRAIVAALADIGFARNVVLETNAPSGDIEMDMIKNLNVMRALIRDRNA
jgi:L-ribulose-5-phosphate 3-epimerase